MSLFKYRENVSLDDQRIKMGRKAVFGTLLQGKIRCPEEAALCCDVPDLNR